MHPLTRACSLLCILATQAAAQTFVVDAANGPGTHFTDLGVATATAPSGSVLLVRAGTYGSFSIVAKSLTVLADPGAVAAVPVQNPIVIERIGVGQTVVVHNLSVTRVINFVPMVYVRIRNNPGTVVLDSMGQSGAEVAFYVAESCNRLILRNQSTGSTAITGWCTLSLVNSNTVIENSQIGRGTNPLVNASLAAVEHYGGTLQVVDPC